MHDVKRVPFTCESSDWVQGSGTRAERAAVITRVAAYTRVARRDWLDKARFSAETELLTYTTWVNLHLSSGRPEM